MRGIDWVNAVGLAALTVVLSRTLLLAKTEPWPWLSEAGDVLYDAGLAILTGWFFNWLVVERPRRREREHMYRAVGHNLSLLARTSRDMIEGLATTSGVTVADANEPTEAEWAAVLAPLDTTTPTPVMVVPLAGGGVRPALAREFIGDHLARAENWVSHLVVALPYFDAELVALVQREQQAGVRHIFRTLPLSGAYRLAGLVEAFDDYARRCKAIGDYYDEHVRDHTL
jgi:hypothetical protein